MTATRPYLSTSATSLVTLAACDRSLRGAAWAHARRGFVHTEVGDRLGRELLDERFETLTFARVDTAEFAAPESAAGRYEIDAHDLVDVVTRFQQLGDARAEFATHSRDQYSHRFTSRGLLLRRESASLAHFGAQMRKEDHFPNGRHPGQQHDEPIDPHAHPAGRRHPVFQRPHVVVVDVVRFGIPRRFERRLGFESTELVDRIVQFAESVREFPPIDDDLEPFDEIGIVAEAVGGLQAASFVGPAGVGAMSDAKYQAFLDAAYADVATLNLTAGTIYYQKSWTALSLLMMTGNLVDFTQI